MSIKIGNHCIGDGHAPYIIAELSGNHNQSFELAKQTIKAAAESGAHAIKLQTYTADSLTISSSKADFIVSDAGSLWENRTLYELYEEAHTPLSWHKPLFEYAREIGITIFSSPFDANAVELLESLDTPCYKIASFENNDYELLEAVSRTGKPVIMSCGASTLEEIIDSYQALKRYGCEDIILLKCMSNYPAKQNDANLSTIPHMKSLFNCPVGFSDHTLGIGSSLCAIALGANMIEKHFIYDKSLGGVDSDFSSAPEEMALLTQEAKNVCASIGSVSYNIKNSTKEKRFKRSIYIVKDIEKGEVISREHVRSIRPGFGIAPKHLETVIGKTVTKTLERGTSLQWEYIS